MTAQFRFRKDRDRVIRFTDALTSAHNALVIMPLNPANLLPTVSVFEMLKKKFQEEHLTVITGDHGLEVMRLLPRTQFIHILAAEVSMLNLPRKDIIERVQKRPYDLAIDLNLDLVLPSGYICKASGARVRVGFVRKRAEMFYNLLIQPDPTLGTKLVYDRLVQCLQRL
jgi:ADP-heptose:LPS heptosyltransferase